MPRKAKKPKTFHFKSWFTNVLRGACRRYPSYYSIRNKVKEEYFVETKMGKQARRVRYECQICHNKVSSKDIRTDHIDPVVPLTGFPMLPNGDPDWNSLIPRMFCPEENLQAICVECHDVKTKAENKQRKDLEKSLTNK